MTKKSYAIIQIILISLFLLYGCSSKEKGEQQKSISIHLLEPTTIDVANIREMDTPLRLSQFVESISYIRLEDEPLIGDALRSSLKVLEDTIYLTSDNVYKYTSNGKFIKQLFNIGQGPDEAKKSNHAPVAFNEKKRYFTFNNNGINNVSYSFDGNFIEKTNYSDGVGRMKKIETYFADYCIYSVDFYVPPGTNENGLGSNLFYVEDDSNSIFYSYPNSAFDEKPQSKGRNVIFPGSMNFINIDSILWFKHSVIDTLYSTSDFVTIHPRYVFKTDDTFMNLREYAQLVVNALDENRYQAKVIRGILPLPTGNLLFLVDKKLAISDISGVTSGYTEEPVLNDLDEHLKNIELIRYIGGRTFCVSSNHLYILVNAFKFFEEGCKPPFEDLKDDSNPIIVKLKLKTQ